MKTKAIGGTFVLTLLLGTFFCMGNGMWMGGRADRSVAEASDSHSCCEGGDASDPESEKPSHACCFAPAGIAGSVMAAPSAPLRVLAYLPGDPVFFAPEQPMRVLPASRAPPQASSPFSAPTASRAPPVA